MKVQTIIRTNEDLGTVTKQVNYSILYMKAVKALQEAMDRIETLEAKVAASRTRNQSEKEKDMTDTPTAEEIAQHYTAMGHSVDLLNAGQPEDMEDADWADTVSRNVEHLTLMVAKDFWTTEDMTAANAAIAANS